MTNPKHYTNLEDFPNISTLLKLNEIGDEYLENRTDNTSTVGIYYLRQVLADAYEGMERIREYAAFLDNDILSTEKIRDLNNFHEEDVLTLDSVMYDFFTHINSISESN